MNLTPNVQVPLARLQDAGKAQLRTVQHYFNRRAMRSGVNYPSALSRHHQIQLWFIPIRDHFQTQWLKKAQKLLFGRK